MLSRFSNLLKYGCNVYGTQIQPVRFRYRIRGKPPGVAKSIDQIIETLNYVDPEIASTIDIGLPPPKKLSRAELAEQKSLLQSKKKDANLEKLSRTLQLTVPLEAVKEEWLKADAPNQIKMAAEHYGVFQDLFGYAYFMPYVALDIAFPLENSKLAPVYRGNVVKPAESAQAPNVAFSSQPNELWTLVLTCPDGHLTESNKEYVHWFIGNIPGGEVSKGEVVWDYLQPFPPRGVGFQRFVFVLYKQEGKIDYSALKKEQPCRELTERTFETLEFYRERQDVLTPAGLAFFQSNYDTTVKSVFHKQLNMEEPRFEYDFVKPYVAPQRWFARRRAFNLYIDLYRDPKDIAKDYLVKKLANMDPFEAPKKPFPYPNIHKVDRSKVASWHLTEQRRVRLGLGRINHQKDEDL